MAISAVKNKLEDNLFLGGSIATSVLILAVALMALVVLVVGVHQPRALMLYGIVISAVTAPIFLGGVAKASIAFWKLFRIECTEKKQRQLAGNPPRVQ